MIAGYPIDTVAILWLGALVGGIAAGGAGFAFGLTASSIWLHRIDPVHSALLINCCGTLLHLTTIWPQRGHIEVKRLWPFVVAGLVGIPIGVRLLLLLDADLLKAVLGVFLLAFGTYALLAPRLHTIRAGGRAADAGSRLYRRHPQRPRRLFRRAADHLDTVARLVESDGARGLPALHNRHSIVHGGGYTVDHV